MRERVCHLWGYVYVFHGFVVYTNVRVWECFVACVYVNAIFVELCVYVLLCVLHQVLFIYVYLVSVYVYGYIQYTYIDRSVRVYM